jgi:hypothetical protein
MLWVSVCYGVAQWYIRSHANEPVRYGATFVPNYAKSFGLDPHETLEAMFKDLGLRQIRLVSYWKDYEPEQGKYNFDELDDEFKLAEQYGAKVSLAIGLRQPRWPECHMPTWAEKMPMTEWAPALKTYMNAVINRYQSSPALESYQLENEFFMDVFGICPDFSRERLVDEYNFVKSIDKNHKVIVSRSNNWVGIPLNEPRADEFGISVYKRVWDQTVTHRYYEYPMPAWFYGMLAGWGKIFTGRDMVIHELQTESWLPHGFQMNDAADIPEQNKSLDAKRLRDRIEYGRATGMKEIYLWGPEWWYWRKEKANDPSLWNTAKEEISKVQSQNERLFTDL